MNCSSFFSNDTLFAVTRLYASDEKFTVYMCQFCIDQILIQESPASAMSAFMILSCLLVHCHCSNVNELLHCGMLCFSGSGALPFVTSVQAQSGGHLSSVVDRPRRQARCRCLDPQDHMAARQKDRFSDLPFTFRKNHSFHICLE